MMRNYESADIFIIPPSNILTDEDSGDVPYAKTNVQEVQ